MWNVDKIGSERVINYTGFMGICTKNYTNVNSVYIRYIQLGTYWCKGRGMGIYGIAFSG
jgi:hypothetical protein